MATSPKCKRQGMMHKSSLYGGEDVRALVFDVGGYSVRVGYAQEIAPSAEVLSSVGYTVDGVDDDNVRSEGYESADDFYGIEINVERSNADGNERFIDDDPEADKENREFYEVVRHDDGDYVASATPPRRSPVREDRRSPVREDLYEVEFEIEREESIIRNRKYYVDVCELAVPRSGVDVRSFSVDGTIEDFDLFEKVTDYIYGHSLRVDPRGHPVLLTERAFNTNAKRSKLTELMFEKHDVPAMYLLKSPVASAFAYGESTALIVDSGSSHTVVSAVVEGYLLKRSVNTCVLASNFLHDRIKEHFERKKVDIIPHYLIADKERVGEREEPRWRQKSNLPAVTQSYYDFAVKRVLQDFQASVLQISTNRLTEKPMSNPAIRHYEFPNGYNQDFGEERYRIPEIIFNPPDTLEGEVISIPNLVTECVLECDPDVRHALLNNVIITGGTTLLPGFAERLRRDVMINLNKNVRIKVLHRAGMNRRFSSWVGGSALASSGTFQQMWVSKKAYEEQGPIRVHEKYL